MATFRKALEYLGLVDADDEYADDGYYDDEYIDEPEPAAVSARTRTHAIAHAPEPIGPVTVVRPVPREAPSELSTTNRPAVVRTLAAKVHVMEPEGFNDAQDVGDRLKAGQPVILNLQGVDRDLQRRLIDFSSGLCYALGGTMEKAAEQVFLLTPSDVEVSQEEKGRLQARGLYRS
ncbi:MAG: cell division inhibitor SepF [Actinomycetota bacterium]|nr:cell division inhibitor SepF [Actinomycetota bacterium]